MSELEPFSPGTRVQPKGNPTSTGTILAGNPRKIGKKIKQRVKWDNGVTDEVSIATLEPVRESDETTLGLIESHIYGRRLSLCDSLVHYRLSGSIEDMIYSYNLTNTEFFAYQFKPLLTFFNSFSNSLLIADEVGLGKTIEAGLIWTELTMRQHAQRLLVICPSQLCEKWRAELQSKFSISAQIVDALELYQAIQEISSGIRRAGVFITSYERIRAPKNWDALSDKEIERTPRARLASLLEKIDARGDIFQMLIVDEAHRLRNAKTQQHRTVANVRILSENTLFLSATPVQTGNDNLFSLLNILDPTTFPYQEALDDIVRLNGPLTEIEAGIAGGKITPGQLRDDLLYLKNLREIYGADTTEIKNILSDSLNKEQLQDKSFKIRLIERINHLNPLTRIMTRTLKRDVQERRVERKVARRAINLNDDEREYYRRITSAVYHYCYGLDYPPGFILSFSQQMMSSSLSASFEYWLHHPAIERKPNLDDALEEASIEGNEEQEVSPLLRELHNIAVSFSHSGLCLDHDSKLEELLKVIHEQKIADGSKKIIVFSFYKATLRYLERKLHDYGISCRRVDGSVERNERQVIVEQFRKGEFDVMLCSEVMAEGVDLQFVDCMVNYDLPWNPARIEQRIGRIDRIGQKSDVITIINFFYQDTIEEKIYRTLLERLDVFTRTLGVAEDVLGEELDKLTKDLFCKKLTPEQVQQHIEQAAMAIERRKLHEEEAKGSSILYDLMRSQLADVQRLQRYVTGDDLKAYVEGFCRQEEGGSRLIHKGENLYSIELSSQARAGLEHFFHDRFSDLAPTEILSNPSLLLRFVNKQGIEPRGIERVTQGHPFIRYISYWRKTNKISNEKTAAIVLSPGKDCGGIYQNIPYGTYAFSAQLWEIRLKGEFRRRSKIGYVAVNMETLTFLSEEDSEILITHAARYGRDLLNFRTLPSDDAILSAVSDAEDHLSEQFESYRASVLQSAQENLSMIESINKNKIKALKIRLDEQIMNLEKNKNNSEGLRKIFSNTFEKKKKELSARIAEAELSLKEQTNNRVPFSSGIIVFQGQP